MRTLLWVLVVYEGVIGISELVNSVASATDSGGSSFLATIEGLPSAGSLVQSFGGMTSGVIDLAVAAGIYYFGIH